MRRIVGLAFAVLAAALALLVLVGLPGGGSGSGAGVATAATQPQQIGMKVLLITSSTDGTTADGAAYADWENTLNREGVPFDSVVTTSQSLPTLSTSAAGGTQVANYEGVIVAGSGTEGLSTAEWTTLETFEHQFSVRQLTAYAVPGPDYGLTAPASGGDSALPSATTPLTITATGATVFPYLKSIALDPTLTTYGAEDAPVAGAPVQTLISGPNASSMVGIYTTADGRQDMYQTFNQGPSYLQSELLRHGELAWLTRNTYFGDQRNYVEMDIDDTFTADDAWNATTLPGSIDYSDANALRMNPGDVATTANWENANDFRVDQLFNMGGSVNYAADNTTVAPIGTDPLLTAFQATCSSDCGPANAGATKSYANSFGWISHTYDTPYLDVGCATQNYIEAELNENTNVAHTDLGLTESTDPTVALGAENPDVFVPGNHSGFADLVPGNPATVDPPDLDTDLTTVNPTGGSLPAGNYEYAVTDQFTNSPTAGQSAAFVTAPIAATGATNSVSLSWESICHAADYLVYRGYEAPTATSYTWTLMPPASGSAYGTVSTPFSATLPDNSSGDPTSTTDVTGGGELEQTYIDTGAAGTAATEPSATAENATELPWEQNPYFAPALAAVGITAVGADGSKPYPDPASDEFGYGVDYTGAEYPADATFALPGTNAQVVPRHPINIYYNASTDYQELNEYQTLYDGTATCADTTCTWSDVVNQVVSQMFGYMMDNDPRPSYVHQTNTMGSPPAGSEGTDGLPPSTYTPQPGGGADEPAGTGNPTTTGDGTLYQVLDPLLYQYNEYFNSTAPFEQLTEQAIATLLADQSAWSASTNVTGSINGNQVTVTNGGTSAIEVPLTGITGVGSAYAGSQSGWASAKPGANTFTALTAWPAGPLGPVTVTLPNGAAPTIGPGTKPIITKTKTPPEVTTATQPEVKVYYRAVQVAPKTVNIKKGKVTVSLKCEASKGKTAKGKICSGKFTLKLAGKSISHKFRIKSTKTDRITITLPKLVQAAIRKSRHHSLSGKLTISTSQSHAQAQITKGTLKIRI
jgi:hypothetical protein